MEDALTELDALAWDDLMLEDMGFHMQVSTLYLIMIRSHKVWCCCDHLHQLLAYGEALFAFWDCERGARFYGFFISMP